MSAVDKLHSIGSEIKEAEAVADEIKRRIMDCNRDLFFDWSLDPESGAREPPTAEFILGRLANLDYSIDLLHHCESVFMIADEAKSMAICCLKGDSVRTEDLRTARAGIGMLERSLREVDSLLGNMFVDNIGVLMEKFEAAAPSEAQRKKFEEHLEYFVQSVHRSGDCMEEALLGVDFAEDIMSRREAG